MPVLAAGNTLPFLGEFVAVITLCIGIAYVCYRLRLVPIVGFLIAGVCLGPSALGVIQDEEIIIQAAELGVILLLFTIGLEFSLERLGRIARAIFVGGGIQVGLTIAVVAGVVMAMGGGPGVAVYTGCLVALSSTAIVLSLLAERGEMNTPQGQLSLATLIFQDLAVVAMVLLVPVLGGGDGNPWQTVWALVRGILVVALVVVVARRVVPPILERIANTRRPELFSLTIVAICLGTAWATGLVGVSLALGAFLAGLVVSESPYSAHALSEVLPLRTLFSALFFVSVGMLLDINFALENLPLLLAIAVGVLLLKAAVTGIAVAVLGYPVRMAALVGLTLAQIGEFSFVLEGAGRSAGLWPADLGADGAQGFIAVTVLLMLATPFVLRAAPWISTHVGRSKLGDLGPDAGPDAAPHPDDAHLEDHVIVVGYGPAGQRLARVLLDADIPFVVAELNPELAERARADGVTHVEQGDAARSAMLEHLGVTYAKVLVVAINDESAAERIVHLGRHVNPTLHIITRTRFASALEPLQKAGADVVVPEELETAVRLFTHVLGAYMVPPDEVRQYAAALRADDYGLFRGSIQEAHLMVLQGLDEDGLHTRAVQVRDGAPAAGRTLEDLALRRELGLTVLAVRRDGKTVGSPAGDFTLRPGDRLVLVGEAGKFARSADLWRTPLVDVPDDDPA